MKSRDRGEASKSTLARSRSRAVPAAWLSGTPTIAGSLLLCKILSSGVGR